MQVLEHKHKKLLWLEEYWPLLLLIAVGVFLRALGFHYARGFNPEEQSLVAMVESMRRGKMLLPPGGQQGDLLYFILYACSTFLTRFDLTFMSYEGIFTAARLLALLFGTLLLPLTYLLALQLLAPASRCARQGALFATALVAFNTLHIQLSHFYTTPVVFAPLAALVLLIILRAARSGDFRFWFWAATAAGVAFAVERKAVLLLVPLAMAYISHAASGRKWWSRMPGALGLVLAFVLAAVVCEPYVLRGFGVFRFDLTSQLKAYIGSSPGGGPGYYAGAAPFLYPFSQMLHYTIGLFPTLLALAGLVVCSSRCARQRALTVPCSMLVWTLLTLVVFSVTFVKNPQDLLAVYPLLFVYAARLLWTFEERMQTRAVLASLLTAWLLLTAVSFARLYQQPHIWTVAAEWTESRLPLGRRIAIIAAPGEELGQRSSFSGQIRRPGALIRIDLLQHEGGMARDAIASQLAGAEYLIFPSDTTVQTVLAAPRAFPHAAQLVRFLYQGGLGFERLETFAVRPALSRFGLNRTAEDPALAAFDHPTVTVFANRAHFSAAELRSRFDSAAVSGGESTNIRSILASPGRVPRAAPSEEGTARAAARSWHLGTVLVWILMLEVFGLVLFPLFAALMPFAPDGGYGAAKTLGLLFIGYLVWILNSGGFLRADRPAILAVIAVAAFVSHLVARAHWNGWLNLLRRHGRPILMIELIFLLMFLGFTIIQAFHPEIFWGEKPMDFGFLNYMIRAERLPPDDPWAAGQAMGYYYLGYYLLALLHKLGSIDSNVGYNLAIATLPALLAGTCYSVVFAATGRRWAGIAAAFAIPLLSNLEGAYLFLFDNRRVDFDDMFWRTTRTFTPPAFTEYPIWSFLFADLHPHVIALPFTVLLFFLGLRLLRREPLSLSTVLHRLLYALVWGALFGLNSWDFLAYGLVTGLLLLFRPFVRSAPVLSLLGAAVLRLIEGALIAGAAYLLMLPFFVSTNAASRFWWGWVTRSELTTYQPFLRHLGVWLAIIVACALAGLLRRGWSRSRSRLSALARVALALLLAGAPLLLVLGSYSKGLDTFPAGLIAVGLLLSAIGFVLHWQRGSLRSTAAGAAAAAAGFLIIGAELIFLLDRMNTIFKFYNSIWVLLGLSAMLLLPALPAVWHGHSVARKLMTLMVSAVPAVLVVAALAGTIMNIAIMTTHRRVRGPRPTLDGAAYLTVENPNEAELIHWLRSNIKGTPTLLEAHGASYQLYTRINKHTGLPVVLGWDYHVSQRGTSGQEIQERVAAVREIYANPDPLRAHELLQRYHVKLLVIGSEERRTYPAAGLGKFTQRPDLFPVLFQSGDNIVFTTDYALRDEPGINDLELRWKDGE